MKCCNYCGSKLNGFQEYCPVCRKKFDLKEQNKDVIKNMDKKIIKNCPSCGSVIYGSSNFCTECGNSLKKDQDYTRLLLPNPINNYPNKVKSIDYIINIPLICPICGNRKELKEFKVKSRFSYDKHKAHSGYKDYHSYLKIFFCKKHAYEMKKNHIINILFVSFLVAIIISLPIMILGLKLTVIIAIPILIGTGSGLIYIVRKNLKITLLIKSHIFHEYYPELGAVVSVKNYDWVEEFSINNKCVCVVGPIEYDLSESELLKRQYEIYAIISLLLILTFGFLGVMFSILMIQKYSNLCYLGLFVFSCVCVYYYFTPFKQDERRLQKYSVYLKFLNI